MIPNNEPVIPWRSNPSVKSSNWQIGSDPGPSAAPSELPLLLLACCCYGSPCLHALITPNVRCTGHKKVPTPAARAKARPDSLSPDPSHFTFTVCLTRFDRVVPNWAPSDLHCPPPTCWSVNKNNRERKCSLCSNNPRDGVCALSNTHTHIYIKTVSHWCQHVRISTLVSSAAPPGTLSLPLSQGKSQRGRQIVWRRR